MSDISRPFRMANMMFAAMFLLSVAVQYNDPDPLPWMAIYLAAAIACILPLIGKHHRALPMLIAGIAFAWAMSLAPDVIGNVGFFELFESISMKDTLVEFGREMGGLLIVVAWMAVLIWKA